VRSSLCFAAGFFADELWADALPLVCFLEPFPSCLATEFLPEVAAQLATMLMRSSFLSEVDSICRNGTKTTQLARAAHHGNVMIERKTLRELFYCFIRMTTEAAMDLTRGQPARNLFEQVKTRHPELRQ
jgi:hypothetical protein